jgi:hypothetical protein
VKAVVALLAYVAVLLAAAAAALTWPAAGAIAGTVLMAAIALAAYFAPAAVARYRRHPSLRTIAILNLAIGWTLIGWAIVLIWAVIGDVFPTPVRRLPCPRCAEAILPAARACRYCGGELPAGWGTGAEIVPLPRRAELEVDGGGDHQRPLGAAFRAGDRGEQPAEAPAHSRAAAPASSCSMSRGPAA